MLLVRCCRSAWCPGEQGISHQLQHSFWVSKVLQRLLTEAGLAYKGRVGGWEDEIVHSRLSFIRARKHLFCIPRVLKGVWPVIGTKNT